MTKTDATRLVLMLATAYPTPAWGDGTIDLYANCLLDLDKDIAGEAVMKIIKGKERAEKPAIGAIRREVMDTMAAHHLIPPELAPDEAWGYVRKAISVRGRNSRFPDTYPAISHTVENIGWETICMSENEEATRAHFLRMYQASITRRIEDRLAAKNLELPGDRPLLEKAKRRLGITGQWGHRELI